MGTAQVGTSLAALLDSLFKRSSSSFPQWPHTCDVLHVWIPIWAMPITGWTVLYPLVRLLTHLVLHPVFGCACLSYFLSCSVLSPEKEEGKNWLTNTHPDTDTRNLHITYCCPCTKLVYTSPTHIGPHLRGGSMMRQSGSTRSTAVGSCDDVPSRDVGHGPCHGTQMTSPWQSLVTISVKMRRRYLPVSCFLCTHSVLHISSLHVWFWSLSL